MRLFAAVTPSPCAVEHLTRAVGAVRAPGEHRSGVRWADPALWHVTLAFYGELPDGVLPDLRDALAAGLAGLPAPDLWFRGAGTFAGRTLWTEAAGVTEADGAALAALVAAARDAGESVGVPTEDRPRHRAHLTLARASGRPGDRSAGLGAVVRALAVYRGPVWSADGVHLVRSRLGAGRGGGPLHEDVAVVALDR